MLLNHDFIRKRLHIFVDQDPIRVRQKEGGPFLHGYVLNMKDRKFYGPAHVEDVFRSKTGLNASLEFHFAARKIIVLNVNQ